MQILQKLARISKNLKRYLYLCSRYCKKRVFYITTHKVIEKAFTLPCGILTNKQKTFVILTLFISFSSLACSLCLQRYAKFSNLPNKILKTFVFLFLHHPFSSFFILSFLHFFISATSALIHPTSFNQVSMYLSSCHSHPSL